MKGNALFRSPQSADPLSWFTKPFWPLALAVAIVLTGVVNFAATLPEDGILPFRLTAVALFALACVIIHRTSSPRLRSFRPRHAIIPLALSWIAVIVSGIGASSNTVDVNFWVAPLGLSVVLAALAPFTSAVWLAAYGLISTTVCGVTALIAFGTNGYWPLFTTVTMGVIIPLQATVASTVFSAYIVDRVSRWVDLPIELVHNKDLVHDFSHWQVPQGKLTSLGDRVTPFIERIAQEGFVTSKDRSLAAQLAKEVRDQLVADSNRSWLDRLAAGRGLTVVDPAHRAGWMTLKQRSAVRSLVLAVSESPVLDAGSLRIELRKQDDDSTAVALSMKLDLPEGRRLMMLAPYYLNLQATVDGLVWEDSEQLNMRFQLPAQKRQPVQP